MTEQLERIVTGALRDLAKDMPKIQLAEVNLDTPLYGSRGCLDSLALVSLIAEIEQRVSEELGKDVVLASDVAVSLRRSPFRTVGSLVEYLATLVGGSSHA